MADAAAVAVASTTVNQVHMSKQATMKKSITVALIATVVLGGIAAGIVIAVVGSTPTNAAASPPSPSTAPAQSGTGTSSSLKILCLHGGGQTAQSFESSMQALRSALGQRVSFVFASSPYPGNLWIRGPPGGKGTPTTSADWAADSFATLDNLISSQGPFDGILGFSQGGAMVVTYLSSASARASFRFAVIFCGYVPSTHKGLEAQINAAAPISTPTAVYYGTGDPIISNAMTLAAADKFSSSTIVSDGGGHAPPSSGAALAAIVDFVNGFLSS